MSEENNKIKFICRDCSSVYEIVGYPGWYVECEKCSGMAIKEGYTIEGKKGEDLVALAKRRSENRRLSDSALQRAAEAQAQEERNDPSVILSKPTKGYGPTVPGGSGPIRISKRVVDSIKEKGKEALKQMGVDEKDLK